MKKAALTLGLSTVILLNVILAVGNGRSSDVLFDMAIELLPFCAVPSSFMFAHLFWINGHRTLAALFGINIGSFVIAMVLLVVHGPLDARILWCVDVLQLDLYLVAFARHWPLLTGRVMSQPVAAV